jgi:hypothetical protein
MGERTSVPIFSNFRHFSMLLQFILNCGLLNFGEGSAVLTCHSYFEIIIHEFLNKKKIVIYITNAVDYILQREVFTLKHDRAARVF